MMGPSRLKFDVFFRMLTSGIHQEFRRPKSIKLSKVNLFPEHGRVFDYFFQRVGGVWASWEDLIDRNATIPSDVKVKNLYIQSAWYVLCTLVI